MAAQTLNINVRKHTLMCVEGGGGRWKVEKERLMGLSLLRKEDRRKERNQFSLRHLRIQMAVRGGKDIKSGNQNN